MAVAPFLDTSFLHLTDGKRGLSLISDRITALTPNSQRGFTYLAMLMFVAITGAASSSIAALWSQGAQREKERELLFVGNQYRQAIEAYYKRAPAGEKRYPASLEELLADRREGTVRHHLRRLYRDPITNSADWGLVKDAGGRILGVHSLSTDTPFKTGNFLPRDQALAGRTRYSDWVFSARAD